MRGQVLDDFRNRIVDILQPGIVQSAQCCVGFGQPQRTKQYLVVVVLVVLDRASLQEGPRLFDRLNVVENGWVDGVVVRRLYRSMAEAFSRGDPSYMDNILELWSVFAVELWFNVVFLGLSEPFKQVTETQVAWLRSGRVLKRNP